MKVGPIHPSARYRGRVGTVARGWKSGGMAGRITVLWVDHRGCRTVPAGLASGMVARTDGQADRRCKAYKRVQKWARES